MPGLKRELEEARRQDVKKLEEFKAALERRMDERVQSKVGHTVMAFIVTTFIVMAHIVMTYADIAHEVTAFVVMALR